jgi:maleamate amidohydrolase
VSPRIWDAYLTDQDRAHVDAKGVRRRPRGSTPALLLVDVYRGVFGDRPEPLLRAIESWPASCGLAGWAALPQIQQLLDATRSAGVPVVHITGMEGVPHWRDVVRAPQPASPEEEDRRRRRFDIMEEVAPIDGEPVFHKAAPSAFFGTPLAAYLNQLRVDSVIVVGESTSGCVRATVVDASSYRFDVVVVEECVFDRHEAAHAINLFDMDQKYGDVLRLDDTIAFLHDVTRRTKETAEVP